MTILYGMTLFVFLLYSYVLVDPNITFFNHPLWNQFRDIVIPIGYYQRELSWYLYLGLVLFLFLLHFLAVTKYKQIRILKIAFIVSVILLLSYPFLSHDFFNYMFDAKIITHYHQNPYIQKALDFPRDPWLRFMHWTHRTYPYGPFFLLVSLIPSFLSFGKFLIAFVLFKAMNLSFYLSAVHFLQRMNKKWAVIFATNPLIIIEGLINGHNDMIALSFGIIGIYYLSKNKTLLARILLLCSAGIKYITLPIFFLKKRTDIRTLFLFIFQAGIIGYLSFASEIQPWYFLSLFIFLPFFENYISRFNIFFLGLLLSYYHYIRLGGWDTKEKIELKHMIVFWFLLTNILFFAT